VIYENAMRNCISVYSHAQNSDRVEVDMIVEDVVVILVDYLLVHLGVW
jgi:hypothetical protein